MNKYIAIFNNDMKNTRRDPTLLVLTVVPVLFILLTRFGLPQLTVLLPVAADYYPIIIVFFSVLTAIMPAFIVSFMLLDEKDQHVLIAYRIMPLEPAGFFGMRMLFMFVIGFIGSLLLLQLNGLVEVNIIQSLVVAFVSAACAPVFVFFTISFAKNKIEGATIMKMLNVILMLPLITLFIDHPLTLIVAFIPFYWIYEGFTCLSNPNQFYQFFGIGLLSALFFNYILYRFALKRFYFK